ncbi:DUF559 domain-containing protein [Bacillus sp. BRMEA1]|uniref:endonuclease domain-containing protein n=1 Tax=Neobacillus endophyticus TaxID=2738405 RepID=UPI0015644B6A|nr:DUF559 domain-containing protein [Neobacillus endophyticus]NRD80320.1 DUF559 domain-containing protein [Neobacillus endophyticus]
MAKSKVNHYLQSTAEKVKKSVEPRVLEEIKEMLCKQEIYLLNSIRNCESPVEKLFCLHLLDWLPHYESQFRYIDSDVTISIFIQKEIEYRGKKYRPDFLIEVYALGNEFDFIVECDGHNFHEKTKAQAKRDKSRDRNLQSAGYRTIRFTGSEIWEDSASCVYQTYQLIETVTGLEEKYMTDHFPVD